MSVSKRQRIFCTVGEAIGEGGRLEMFPDVARFSARLRRFNHPEIIVLLAVGEKDMPSIIALRDFIRDAAVILMLSEEDPETMTSAILLRPKFIGMMDRDLDKIVPIIKIVRPTLGLVITLIIRP